MTNRIISSDVGMDAIDELIFLGYKIVRNIYGDTNVPFSEFVLITPTYKTFSVDANMASISCFREMIESPEHHEMLIQQKGLAYGN